MCYKDMTFCDYYKTCKNGLTCHRALTREVVKDAHKWFGSERAPICIFAEKPECYTEIEVDNA